MQFKSLVCLAVLASANAFAPQPFGTARASATQLYNMVYGKYDGKVWDGAAKNDVYDSWDPNAPRSALNFNPYETWDGNSPDASGNYPGEGRYKDPVRPDMNYAIMLAERAEAEKRAANPKAGDKPGCPGCRT